MKKANPMIFSEQSRSVVIKCNQDTLHVNGHKTTHYTVGKKQQIQKMYT